ncbi:MAG TPA: hypothetical protein VJ346_09170 [Bacteroidales bacterium]|nr:hypothetical protein [Bacteroidales bacterium]
MKKIFLSFLIVLLAVITFAQAPEMLNYQAVVRNSSGDLIKSTSVSLRISILQATETGTAVYTETHNATTNSQGLLNLKIGNGTSSDNFANIDWAGNIYFLKVEMDPAGGTAYSHYSTSQILSVPYALFAKNADMLDGQTGAYYQNASNISSGALDNDRYNSYAELDDANRLDNNSGADILLRTQADTMYGRQSAFYAYNSVTDAVTTVNSTQVEFNMEGFDIGNDFSTTTDLFTVPYRGIYQFNAGVMVGEVIAGDRIALNLTVNGTDQVNLVFNQMAEANDNQTLSGSVTVSLDAGDTVGLSVDSLTDDIYTVFGSTSGLYTYFSGSIAFRRF